MIHTVEVQRFGEGPGFALTNPDDLLCSGTNTKTIQCDCSCSIFKPVEKYLVIIVKVINWNRCFTSYH